MFETTKKTNESAEKIAEKIFKETGDLMPSEMSLISWAEEYYGNKISVEKLNLSNCLGVIYYNPKNGGAQIKIKSDDSETRQRFTLCHEIGHLIIGMNEACGYSVGEIYTHKGKERFCDRFAAAFLMPKTLFCYKWSNFSKNENIQIRKYKIAKFFNVSVDAANFRLKELDLINW